MRALKRDISEYTNKVLRVLNAKTIILDSKGRGQKNKKEANCATFLVTTL